jgi:hypothetical protein
MKTYEKVSMSTQSLLPCPHHENAPIGLTVVLLSKNVEIPSSAPPILTV